MSKKRRKRKGRAASRVKNSSSSPGSGMGASPSSQGTLVSLAILKSLRDTGQDYLELLRPFILHVLCNNGLETINDASVTECIEKQFGLVVPTRTTQLVLRRIVSNGGLVRVAGSYQRTDGLPYTNLNSNAATAGRHINSLVAGLGNYAKSLGHEYPSDEDAILAICDFLLAFGVDSLRAILRDTALPDTVSPKSSHYVVAAYIRDLQKSDPGRFESFSVLAQGHMLANALVCPDLVNAPKTFNEMVFFLDTPLLVQSLSLEGEPRRDAALELFRLIIELGGRLAVFEHNRDELERVIRGASDNINSPKGRGRIVIEARRSGTTVSDLLLLAAKLDDKLQEMGVEVHSTPDYESRLQIDEAAFADILEDEVSYYNDKARQNDINSIRSIYSLRHGRTPRTLERAAAVLVTTNAALSKAAYLYGRQHEESTEVSSTITDFSLANLAWLKAPMKAPSLPTKELLSVAYAAVKPSAKLLDDFLAEAEKLLAQGGISERDLQVLRSDLRAQDSLMALTLGDDEALTEETVTETLRRVQAEILHEADGRFADEAASHEVTRMQLASASGALENISRAAHQRSLRWGSGVAWTVSAMVAVLIVAGLAFGLVGTGYGALRWLIVAGMGVVTILTVGNLLLGTTVKDIHGRLRQRVSDWVWDLEQNRANGKLIARADLKELTDSKAEVVDDEAPMTSASQPTTNISPEASQSSSAVTADAKTPTEVA